MTKKNQEDFRSSFNETVIEFYNELDKFNSSLDQLVLIKDISNEREDQEKLKRCLHQELNFLGSNIKIEVNILNYFMNLGLLDEREAQYYSNEVIRKIKSWKMDFDTIFTKLKSDLITWENDEIRQNEVELQRRILEFKAIISDKSENHTPIKDVISFYENVLNHYEYLLSETNPTDSNINLKKGLLLTKLDKELVEYDYYTSDTKEINSIILKDQEIKLDCTNLSRLALESYEKSNTNNDPIISSLKTKNMGDAKYVLNEFDKAIDYYHESYTFDSNYVEPFFAEWCILSELGKYQAALDCLDLIPKVVDEDFNYKL